MSEQPLRLRAAFSATALERPVAAASATWPSAEWYSVDPESGVMLQVTADTVLSLGGGCFVYGIGAAWIPPTYTVKQRTIPSHVSLAFDDTHGAAVDTIARLFFGLQPVVGRKSKGERHPGEATLIDAIKSIFPGAFISTADTIDSEEGWPIRLVKVITGLEEPDKLTEAENKFYDLVSANETLIATLRSTTVLFR